MKKYCEYVEGCNGELIVYIPDPSLCWCHVINPCDIHKYNMMECSLCGAIHYVSVKEERIKNEEK